MNSPSATVPTTATAARTSPKRTSTTITTRVIVTKILGSSELAEHGCRPVLEPGGSRQVSIDAAIEKHRTAGIPDVEAETSETSGREDSHDEHPTTKPVGHQRRPRQRPLQDLPPTRASDRSFRDPWTHRPSVTMPNQATAVRAVPANTVG